MDWGRDLPGWPLARLSRRVACRPHLWHVQEDGSGETLLLLHGAGASTHSWRDVLPRLAQTRHVVAVDLPGQGFTGAGTLRRCGLDPMTADIAALCAAQGWQPRAIVGHSAGAAIALNLAPILARGGRTPAIIGINAALGHFEGMAGWLFPVLARLLALNPLTAAIFTMGSDKRARARRLIAGTGSDLDATGIALYAQLIGDRAHVEATLQMMAQWRIEGLLGRLPELDARCLFLTGDRDRAVPPSTSEQIAGTMRDARTLCLPELGHLAHEEAPDTVTAAIEQFLSRDA